MREKTIYEKIAEKYNTTPEEVRSKKIKRKLKAGSIYGKFESSHKEGEPDVVGTFSVNRDENKRILKTGNR